MSKIQAWVYIIVAVLVALSANSISAIWASKENKFSSPWFLALILISPFVFIAFGLAVEKMGVTISSATIDLLLTVGTILVGLFLFHEWGSLSAYQFIGLAFAIGGIILMHLNM